MLNRIQKRKKELILETGQLGDLNQISDKLMEEMRKEIDRNGYSDLTLAMEGFAIGIDEIVRLNNIKFKGK